MNKLQVKQIYLLTIIVAGILALSVYSTYSIFTLESETSNILTIHTPNSLNISTNISEYRQVNIPKNSYITTDIDIYNNFKYDLCYSIWYNTLNNQGNDSSKVKVYEKTASSLTTSSTISSVESRRINLLITNDNEADAKVNIGIVYSQNEGTCELHIDDGKSLIKDTINNPKELSKNLIQNTAEVSSEEGYYTYKDIDKEIELNDDIYISNNFTYKSEVFTLTNGQKISLSEIFKYVSTETENYYTCLSEKTCSHLYRITRVNEHNITKYDYLSGYLGGINGLRKINNNYYYYGDNPANFIYYNCLNEMDTKTCELWRIIGFIYDKNSKLYYTKIIKNDFSSTSEYNNENNSWKESTISKYLDTYKLNNSNNLKEIAFKTENLLNLESDITNLNEENKAKTTLMNLSDFINASVCDNKKISEYDAHCLNNNWLNKNTSEWTMTVKYEIPYTNEETGELVTPSNDTVYSIGNNISLNKITDELSLRPVLYLNSRTFYIDGNGTFNNPYIIR